MKSGRNRNPYQGIDWGTQIRVTGCTHLHCQTPEEFDRALKGGLEFATISNYYPSSPYYPLNKLLSLPSGSTESGLDTIRKLFIVTECDGTGTWGLLKEGTRGRSEGGHCQAGGLRSG